MTTGAIGAVAGILIGRLLGAYVAARKDRWQAELDKRPQLSTVLKVVAWAVLGLLGLLGLALIAGLAWFVMKAPLVFLAIFTTLLAILAVAGLVGLIAYVCRPPARRIQSWVRLLLAKPALQGPTRLTTIAGGAVILLIAVSSVVMHRDSKPDPHSYPPPDLTAVLAAPNTPKYAELVSKPDSDAGADVVTYRDETNDLTLRQTKGRIILSEGDSVLVKVVGRPLDSAAWIWLGTDFHSVARYTTSEQAIQAFSDSAGSHAGSERMLLFFKQPTVTVMMLKGDDVVLIVGMNPQKDAARVDIKAGDKTMKFRLLRDRRPSKSPGGDIPSKS